MNKLFGRVITLLAIPALFACTLTPTPALQATPTPPSSTETAAPSLQPVDTATSTLVPPTETITAPAEPPTLSFTPSLTPPPVGELVARLGKGVLLGYAFSPDGKTLAVLTGLGISLYSPATLYETAFVAAAGLERIAYRSDGVLLASVLQTSVSETQPAVLTVWQVQNAALEQLAHIESPAWPSNRGPYAYVFSPDGARIAFLNGSSRRLEILQISDSSLLGTWDIPSYDKPAVPGANDPSFAFSYDSGLLAFCDGFSAGGNITVLSVQESGLTPTFTLSLDEQVAHYADQNYWPTRGEYGIGLAISPDNQLLAVGGPDNQVRVWNMGTQKLVTALKDLSFKGAHVAFSPDGKVLTVVNADRLYLYTTRDWKLMGGQTQGALDRPLAPAGGEVAFMPDSSQSVSAFADTIYFTNLHNGYRGNMISGFMGPFWELAISRDGSTLAVAGKQIYLYDLPNHSLKRMINASSGGVHSLTFSPDGTLLAATMDYPGEGCDGWAEIWRVEDGSEVERVDLTPVQTQQACVGNLAYSADGKRLAIQVKINQNDSLAQLWRVDANGGTTHLRDLALPGMDWIEFSPDSTRLVSYTGDAGGSGLARGVAAWNLSTDAVELTQTDELRAMRLVHATSVGWLATLGWVTLAVDASDRLIAARGGVTNPYQVLQSVPVVDSKSFVISPSMEWVAMAGAIGSEIHKVWIWRINDGRLAGAVPGIAARFSPDGRLLVAIESDGTIAVWKLK
jgi:WD40 repeat protein